MSAQSLSVQRLQRNAKTAQEKCVQFHRTAIFLHWYTYGDGLCVSGAIVCVSQSLALLLEALCWFDMFLGVHVG